MEALWNRLHPAIKCSDAEYKGEVENIPGFSKWNMGILYDPTMSYFYAIP